MTAPSDPLASDPVAEETVAAGGPVGASRIPRWLSHRRIKAHHVSHYGSIISATIAF